MGKVSEKILRERETIYKLAWHTIEALRALKGTARIRQIGERVEEIAPHYFLDVKYDKGRSSTIAQDQLSWSRTFLRKAGLVENIGWGMWTLTNRGYDVDSEQNTIRLCKEAGKKANKEYRQEEQGKKRRREEIPGGKEAEKSPWQERAIGILSGMDPTDFERFCTRMLVESGFEATPTQPSRDGGIDIVGRLKTNNLISTKVGVQCKCYADTSVGEGKVKEFWASLDDKKIKKGIFMTTSTFAKGARKYADKNDIDLFDGDELCELMEKLAKEKKESGLKLKRVVDIYEVDEDFFSKFRTKPKKD